MMTMINVCFVFLNIIGESFIFHDFKLNIKEKFKRECGRREGSPI